MKLQVTNKGPARTVDFLGVFSEGETREFDQTELENFQNLSGVPIFAGPLADEDQFDVLVIGQKEEGN